MTIQAQLATLKQQLEHLFPGKWLSGKDNSKTLFTGISQIDVGLHGGLARQRITEWTGLVSSGKTTILRSAIANWCAAGFHVAYVDKDGKLLAADWSYIQKKGRFWVVRCQSFDAPSTTATEEKMLIAEDKPAGNLSPARDKSIVGSRMFARGAREPPGFSTQPALRSATSMPNAHLYVASELVRSNNFDVVVLDLGSISGLSSRVYARLQKSLARSRAALIVVRDGAPAPAGWGCHTQLTFSWGKPELKAGLNGVAAIVPSIHCGIWRDGMTTNVEVVAGSHVSNRLFTHSPVPDRRTAKR